MEKKDYKDGIAEVIAASNTNKERIFPILNKIEKIWSKNTDLQFCAIVKLLKIEDNELDLVLTKRLDDYIDDNKPGGLQ